MTRRTILLTGLGLVAYQKPLYPELSDQDYDGWQEVAKAWNPFSEKLNSGVFDIRLWRSARKALQHVGVCEK